MNEERARSAAGGGSRTSGITRRTVTRGMAWTAPVVLTSVAAPAFAASTPCVTSDAAMQRTTSVVNALSFSNSTNTATLAYTTTGWGSDNTPGETGWIRPTPYSPSWNYIKLHHTEEMDFGDTITLTIMFTTPVNNLNMTITDIDQNTVIDDNNRWIDDVVVTPTPTVVPLPGTAGDNVVGNGTAASPFRSTVNENIETDKGDVQLYWEGPVQTVTITYKVAFDNNLTEWGQQIGVGKISFTNDCYPA